VPIIIPPASPYSVTSLDLFLPLVIPYVYQCPEPAALQALRLAAIDFCKKTDAVQRVIDAADVVAGVEDYTVVAPTNMVLARVLGVGWNGHWLIPLTPGDVRSDVALRGVAVGDAELLTGDPMFFFQKTPQANVVSLYPVPDTALAAGITVKASFFPTMSAGTVDSQLYDDWGEGIAAGALARLKATSGVAYSADPRPDAIRYERAVGEAKRQVQFGKQTNQSRIMPRRFA